MLWVNMRKTRRTDSIRRRCTPGQSQSFLQQTCETDNRWISLRSRKHVNKWRYNTRSGEVTHLVTSLVFLGNRLTCVHCAGLSDNIHPYCWLSVRAVVYSWLGAEEETKPRHSHTPVICQIFTLCPTNMFQSAYIWASAPVWPSLCIVHGSPGVCLCCRAEAAGPHCVCLHIWGLPVGLEVTEVFLWC